MMLLLIAALTGSCHVIANGTVSDWMVREDAYAQARGWLGHTCGGNMQASA